jgi:hypothetical protein
LPGPHLLAPTCPSAPPRSGGPQYRPTSGPTSALSSWTAPQTRPAFLEISLYVEALCLHEWCLFAETVKQGEETFADRGEIYRLLTDRPDSRRPLTWERNNIDILIVEGNEFVCPWTERSIGPGVPYEIDHLVPVSVYPINELWNLVPSDPAFNSRVKRDRFPSPDRLVQAEPHLVLAYTHYGSTQPLAQSLRDDVAGRFATVKSAGADFPAEVAQVVVGYIGQVAESRSLARF